MIELRSTANEDNDALKVQLISKKYDSNRSSNTQYEGYKREAIKPLSPFKLKKSPLIKPIQHAQHQADDSMSDTSYRQNEPEEFKQKIPMSSNFVFDKYKITDLTFSLVNSNLNIRMLTIFFFIQIVIRYFSIGCLIYLMIQTSGVFWEWIFIWVFNNFLYFVCIVKISIKFPQTQSETILKDSFNSLYQSEHIQYFQVIDSKKLWTSIVRGMVPPELSFIYIKDMRTSQRHLHIYVMINYIYSSIQAVIFYPFVIIYTIQVYGNQISQYGAIFYFSYAIIVLSEVMFVILSVILTIHGCRKKGYLIQPKQT